MKTARQKLNPARFILRIPHYALCIALALRASAAVPLRFVADAETPRTYQASAYRGETLDIEARLTWRGAPLAVSDGAEAAMCWQTNGKDDAWWTAPASVTTGGVITATWSPSNDVGAATYRIFLRVSGHGGASYRANMLLRILGSPGETPNALPLPVKFLDFARITVTNAPWGTGGTDGEAVTNIVEGIVAAATNNLARGVEIDLQGKGPTNVTSITSSPTIYWEMDPDGSLVKAVLDTLIAAEQLHDEGLVNAEDLAGYATRTNLPSLSADATVGDLVDRINAVIGALHKEDDE